MPQARDRQGRLGHVQRRVDQVAGERRGDHAVRDIEVLPDLAHQDHVRRHAQRSVEHDAHALAFRDIGRHFHLMPYISPHPACMLAIWLPLARAYPQKYPPPEVARDRAELVRHSRDILPYSV